MARSQDFDPSVPLPSGLAIAAIRKSIDYIEREAANEREQTTVGGSVWLSLAHQKLAAAVFAAYGWPENVTDDEILEKLGTLNLKRESVIC